MLHHRLAVAVSCRSSSSIEEARRRAADSSPRCRWWRPLAAVAVSTGALVAQSGLPPLFGQLSIDGGATWKQSVAGDGQFLMIRCVVPADASGGWYSVIADACVTDSAYQEYLTNGGMAAMAPQQFELGQVVSPYAPPSSYSNPDWVIKARPDDVSAFLVSTLGGPAPNLLLSSVTSFADPLYVPVPAQPFIVQVFGLTEPDGWVPNDSGAFNLDAVLQKAVWRRVSGSGEYLGSQDAFFNESIEWRKLLQTQMHLNLTLIGMRGPLVTIGVPAGGNPPPDLDDYPASPPQFAISPLALVTFVGTGVEFNFFESWTAPVVPCPHVPAGGTLVLPASGFRPDMQVSLHGVPPNGAPRFEVPVLWSSPGRVAMQIPPGTGPGTYEVRNYRYRTQLPGGGFQEGPWTQIEALLRPQVTVL